jgi:hypothetical protein
LKHELNKLNKTKVFDNQIIIILAIIIEYGRAKDGKTIDKDEIKDGKIIKVTDKIEMVSLAKMGITEMAITKIITIKIMEIGKEGI